jgi:RNA polymerase sigma-70 factor (ECF subfamily)
MPPVEVQRLPDAAPVPARAGASDRPTLRAVFESEFSYVFASLRRLGVREADLEDVTHDVFLVVHDKLADFDPTRPLRAWLFGIAFRVASDYRRRAHHRREVHDADREAVDPSPPVEGRIADAERRHLLLDALEALDVDKRAVLVMHDIDGHTAPVIAAALGIPLNTVYSRLRLARAEMRAAVESVRREQRVDSTRREPCVDSTRREPRVDSTRRDPPVDSTRREPRVDRPRPRRGEP